MDKAQKPNVKHALNERDGFQVWWRLLRPHTLTASFIPVFVGTMLAYTDGSIHLGLFFAMLMASILIQAATNMFNEYYDYARGLDTEHSVGIGGTIVRDNVSPKTVLNLALAFFSIAILLGIYISIASSWWIAVIGAAGMVVGYLYTGGPLPIAYTPFGEIFSGFLMGTVIIAISYFIQTMTLTLNVIWVSLPIAIFIATIMMTNNIRDLDNDKKSGRKTIAILLGRKNAVRFQTGLFMMAYGLTIFYMFIGLLPIWSIITLIGGIKAIEVIQILKNNTEPLEIVPAMAATGKNNTFYGFLLGISLLLSRLF